MRTFIFVFILLYSLYNFSQNNSVKAQLQFQLDSTTQIKEKVQLYADLAWEYIITENDSALVFADKALQLSKTENYPLGEAIAYETKGLYHEIATGNYDEASTFYFEGIKVCEANNLDYVSSIYHSLGVMFHTSDNYKKALEYYTTSYNLAKKASDSILIKKCLINLGSINSSLEDFDKAAFYMEQSFNYKVRQELDYSTYCNLGYLYTKQKKYTKALPYLLKATEQNPDNPDSEINLYFLLNLKAESKDTIGIKPVLKRAKAALNEAVGPRNKSLLLRNLADYYKSSGNFEEALHYRDLYVNVFENIKEKQRDDTVIELQTKYETEKKDTELKLLKVEGEKKEKQNQLYFILAISGICIASLLGYFAYRNRKQKDALEVLVEEKNVLFKEIHHRVKNSLQMVSSLLFLQSQNIEDKEAKNAIKDAQNRVRSLGLIHQKLYSKRHIVGVETKDYIGELTQDIFSSHQLESQNLDYNFEIENMVLNVDTLTPIGLILNELIVNVLKHAFKHDQTGNKLDIQFYKNEDTLILKVADNGIGFNKDTVRKNSFGLKLINSLARKLDATFTIKAKTTKGTEAILVINDYEILENS